MTWNILIVEIWVRDQNSQNIPAPDNNLKFFLLQEQETETNSQKKEMQIVW